MTEDIEDIPEGHGVECQCGREGCKPRECNSCMKPAVAECAEGIPFCEEHLKEHNSKVHLSEDD